MDLCLGCDLTALHLEAVTEMMLICFRNQTQPLHHLKQRQLEVMSISCTRVAAETDEYLACCPYGSGGRPMALVFPLSLFFSP